MKGFAKEIKRGTVEFHYIDFQDENNAALTNGYKVGGPTLIVAQVVGNKVKEYKNLTEIWAKNGDKDEFLKYVRDNVAAYQKVDVENRDETRVWRGRQEDELILSDRLWRLTRSRHLGTDDALRQSVVCTDSGCSPHCVAIPR